jgi:hypothetical protein
MRHLILIAVIAAAATAACDTTSEEAEPVAATTTDTARTTTAELASAQRPTPAGATCDTRSEAEFGGAFADPANLVAGPLVLVGAGEPQPVAVVEAHGGQKFPLLVRAGHTVLVEVPADARELVALGYGPLPQGEIHFADGHPAVRFEACPRGGPSSSTAGRGEPVTFWSGFVLVSEPMCAPLDVYIDDETRPRRVKIALGADC